MSMRPSQSLPNINRDPPPHLRAHAGVRPPKGGWGQQGPGPRLLLLQNPSPTRQSNRSIAANKTKGGNGNPKLQSALSTNGAVQQHHATRIGPVNGDFSPMAKTKKLAGNADANPSYNQPLLPTAGVSTAFSAAPSTYQAPFVALTTTYASMATRDGVPPPQSKNRSAGPTGGEIGAGDTAPPATPGGHRPARARRRKHVHEPGRAGVQFRPFQFGVPEKYKLAYQAMPDPPDPFNNPPPKPTNNPYVQRQRRDNEFKLVASRWVRPPRPQDLEHPDQFYFSGSGSSLSAPTTMNLDQPQLTNGAQRSFGSSAPLPIEYIQPPPPPPPVHPPVSNLKMAFTPGLAPKPLEPGERNHLQAADMFSKSSPFAGAHTASGGHRAPLALTHSASTAHTGGAAKGSSPAPARAAPTTNGHHMGASASAPVLVAKPKGGAGSSTKKKEPAAAAAAAAPPAASKSGSSTPPVAAAAASPAEKKADAPSAPGGPAAAADLPAPSQSKQDLPAPSQQAPPAAATATPTPVAAAPRPASGVQSQPVASAAATPAPAPVAAAPAQQPVVASRPASGTVTAATAPTPAPAATVRAASIIAAPAPSPAPQPVAAAPAPAPVVAAPAPTPVAAAPSQPSASPKGDYAADGFDE